MYPQGWHDSCQRTRLSVRQVHRVSLLYLYSHYYFDFVAANSNGNAPSPWHGRWSIWFHPSSNCTYIPIVSSNPGFAFASFSPCIIFFSILDLGSFLASCSTPFYLEQKYFRYLIIRLSRHPVTIPRHNIILFSCTTHCSPVLPAMFTIVNITYHCCHRCNTSCASTRHVNLWTKQGNCQLCGTSCVRYRVFFKNSMCFRCVPHGNSTANQLTAYIFKLSEGQQTLMQRCFA